MDPEDRCKALLIYANQECGSDAEKAHDIADTAIIEYIRAIGKDELADLWDLVPKWYS